MVCDHVKSKVGSFRKYRKSDNAIFQMLLREIQYIVLQVISLIRHATFAKYHY